MVEVTYTNLIKRGGRWTVEGEVTVTGTVVDYGKAITVSDADGQMLKAIAKYLVVSIKEVSNG